MYRLKIVKNNETAWLRQSPSRWLMRRINRLCFLLSSLLREIIIISSVERFGRMIIYLMDDGKCLFSRWREIFFCCRCHVVLPTTDAFLHGESFCTLSLLLKIISSRHEQGKGKERTSSFVLWRSSMIEVQFLQGHVLFSLENIFTSPKKRNKYLN